MYTYSLCMYSRIQLQKQNDNDEQNRNFKNRFSLSLKLQLFKHIPTSLFNIYRIQLTACKKL